MSASTITTSSSTQSPVRERSKKPREKPSPTVTLTTLSTKPSIESLMVQQLPYFQKYETEIINAVQSILLCVAQEHTDEKKIMDSFTTLFAKAMSNIFKYVARGLANIKVVNAALQAEKEGVQINLGSDTRPSWHPLPTTVEELNNLAAPYRHKIPETQIRNEINPLFVAQFMELKKNAALKAPIDKAIKYFTSAEFDELLNTFREKAEKAEEVELQGDRSARKLFHFCCILQGVFNELNRITVESERGEYITSLAIELIRVQNRVDSPDPVITPKPEGLFKKALTESLKFSESAARQTPSTASKLQRNRQSAFLPKIIDSSILLESFIKNVVLLAAVGIYIGSLSYLELLSFIGLSAVVGEWILIAAALLGAVSVIAHFIRLNLHAQSIMLEIQADSSHRPIQNVYSRPIENPIQRPSQLPTTKIDINQKNVCKDKVDIVPKSIIKAHLFKLKELKLNYPETNSYTHHFKEPSTPRPQYSNLDSSPGRIARKLKIEKANVMPQEPEAGDDSNVDGEQETKVEHVEHNDGLMDEHVKLAVFPRLFIKLPTENADSESQILLMKEESASLTT